MLSALSKRTKFFIAIGIQLAVLFVIIVFHIAILTGGTEIILRVQPIDPTSPLRGDYATFQYANISDLSSYLFNGQAVKAGDTVYVVLYQNGNYWDAQRAQRTKPSSDQVFLKGRVVGTTGAYQTNLPPYTTNTFSTVEVTYGIEDYYIPEGKGRGVSFWGKEVTAKIVVDSEGNGIVKQVYLDGKPWPQQEASPNIPTVTPTPTVFYLPSPSPLLSPSVSGTVNQSDYQNFKNIAAILAPVQGEILCLGQNVTIRWRVPADDTEGITLKIAESANGDTIHEIGSFPATYSTNSPGYGTYKWLVGYNVDHATLVPGPAYHIFLQGNYKGWGLLTADSPLFTITKCAQ